MSQAETEMKRGELWRCPIPDPDCVCAGTGLVTTLAPGGGDTGARLCSCVVPTSDLQAVKVERDEWRDTAQGRGLISRAQADARAKAAEAREDALRKGVAVAHSLCSIDTGDYYAAVLGIESILRSLLTQQATDE